MHSPVTIFAFPLLAIRIDEAANGGREELATVASKGCTSQGIAAADGTPKNIHTHTLSPTSNEECRNKPTVSKTVDALLQRGDILKYTRVTAWRSRNTALRKLCLHEGVGGAVRQELRQGRRPRCRARGSEHRGRGRGRGS
jgi:hypothetical protein